MTTAPRRARVDADRISEAAERPASAIGITSLTLPRLGRELGADHTAVFRHFRDERELLLDRVAERLFGRG